uniref:Neurotrypsin n=1 Tax=Echeneis naucrates TaxID=173247 RepID=A0A665UPM6_ECHNA
MRLKLIVQLFTLHDCVSSAPPPCPDLEDQGHYNGSVSHTDSGSPCLKWTDFPDYLRQHPGRGLGDHNHCRSPDQDDTPWCFFREQSGAVSWAYCDCHQGAVRLVGGASGNSGRVEIYLNHKWGAVCDTHWTDRDATVICRQLGLGEIGTALQHSYFSPGSVFHYERLSCRGNEKSLLECRSRKFVSGDCSHGNEAGMVCSPLFLSGVPLRLVDGLEDFEGRVEVYYRGRWGTVCDNQWDDTDADVVCRQLGLGGVAKAWNLAHYGQGSGPILLDQVQCSGNELSLEECSHNSWEMHNCDHREDAGVSCNPYTDGAVRLVGANSWSEGRVEIYHQGAWGSVCDDNWTELNAQVVCRQLGFRSVAPDGSFEEGQGPILLDEVQCQGSEVRLLDCSHSGWGQHDCSHSEDVGVRCERRGAGMPGPLLRLVSGETRAEGRVEVFINGRWGSICDDGWNDINAAVVCKQLGFSGTAKARSMAYFGEGLGPIHLDNVRCFGSETSLGQCAFANQHDCRHSEDASVICDYTVDPLKDEAAKTTCGLRINNQGRRRRIIGGDKSLRGEWPWQVSLWLRSQARGNHPLCGASLISSCWVVTAAHCFKRFGRDPTRYMLRLGDYHTEEQDDFERTLSPERIVVHRKYQSQGWEYDIALLRLKGTEGECVAFNPHTGTVCLPEPGNQRERKPAACIITGWGVTDSEYPRTLLQAWVPLLPAWKCKKRYGKRFTSRMLCAGSLSERHRVDSCQGDSGGPLVCQGEGGRWVLTGVISWGHGCGNPSFPGVYTRVSRFLQWINKVINKPYKA